MALYLHARKLCTTNMIGIKIDIQPINALHLCSMARMFYELSPYDTLGIR